MHGATAFKKFVYARRRSKRGICAIPQRVGAASSLT